MSWPDAVNGLFEGVGGLMNWMNVAALYKDKQVKGVRLAPSVMFFLWGLWNLYYYPSLKQTASFMGGLVIVTANLAWVSLAVKYGRK